jgi:hypothetical protein
VFVTVFLRTAEIIDLSQNLMLFYTARTRKAGNIVSVQHQDVDAAWRRTLLQGRVTCAMLDIGDTRSWFALASTP